MPEKPAEDMTVPELKAELDKDNVDYPSNAVKDELVCLVEAQRKKVAKSDAKSDTKSTGEADTRSSRKGDEEVLAPNPSSPMGDLAPVGPHPSAPTADPVLTGQTGQYHPDDQSILDRIAAAPSAATHAEEVVVERLAAMAGDPAIDGTERGDKAKEDAAKAEEEKLPGAEEKRSRSAKKAEERKAEERKTERKLEERTTDQQRAAEEKKSGEKK